MGVNKVNLVGRLGKDPDFHYIDKNTTVSRLRIVVKDCDYDADGNKGKYTTWVNVVLWNRLAFMARNRLYKGAAVAVEGRMVNHSYVDKDGNKHYMLEVEANSIEWLSTKKTSATKENSSNVAIEKSAMELKEADVSEELSINDVEMPKKRGRKKETNMLHE